MADPIADNPFYVLELPPDCPPAAVEESGQRLLGMLELGLSAAAEYATPLGRRPRDASRVRAAMAALRDPARRLRHEVWARVPPAPAEPAAAADGDPRAPWPQAFRAFGWQR